MESFLLVTEDLKRYIKDLFGKSDEDIKQDLYIIYEWWEKQPHLPKMKDDDMLERMLMRNKFRVEQTKKKLDAYFTLRGLYSEYFCRENFDPTSESVENCQQLIIFTPIKIPTENGERIIFSRMKTPNGGDLFNFGHVITYMLVTFELLSQYDYCSSTRAVVDLANFKWPYYKKVEPAALGKLMKLWQEGLSCRIAGLHYINGPGFMGLIVKLMSSVVKGGKIHVHDSLEDLWKIVPQTHLPEEYGGYAGKLEDIQDEWTKEIAEQTEFLAERAQMVSNEKLRIGESPYNELFGSEGTFKRLNLD